MRASAKIQDTRDTSVSMTAIGGGRASIKGEIGRELITRVSVIYPSTAHRLPVDFSDGDLEGVAFGLR